MEFLTIRNVLIVVGGYIIFSVSKKILDAKNKNKLEGKDDSLKKSFGDALSEFFVPIERYPKGIRGLSDKSLGGQPEFYNEVDHSRGRFLGWERTPYDLGDPRKTENGFMRARISRDVTYFWFIKGHKTELTPCVFRPGIDAITRGPGEEDGVPPEGIVIFKRSLDGMRLASGHSERYRSLLLDEKHKNSILADMILNMKSKERIAGAEDTSREATEEIENKLKRTKKMHDVAGGRSGAGDMMGNHYGPDMYGPENIDGNAPSGDGLWKFDG